MTHPTPTSDERLLELVRQADPLQDATPSAAAEAGEALDADRLLAQILRSPRGYASRPARPLARRRRRLAVGLASGGGAAAAVAAAVLFTAGSTPGVAVAGWRARPTTLRTARCRPPRPAAGTTTSRSPRPRPPSSTRAAPTHCSSTAPTPAASHRRANAGCRQRPPPAHRPQPRRTGHAPRDSRRRSPRIRGRPDSPPLGALRDQRRPRRTRRSPRSRSCSPTAARSGPQPRTAGMRPGGPGASCPPAQPGSPRRTAPSPNDCPAPRPSQ